MANDSEKRFHSIMDKLFHPPPSNSQSTPSPSSSSGVPQLSGRKGPYQSMELNRRVDVTVTTEGYHSSSATATAATTAVCRPWHRGDLMKRLATFKSISWFAKPKIVSAVNCARRGWINVDVDTIACEACGARLLFSTPASWNQQQVEKAALVFSLKLDNGHKLLCPWVDNACNETLARFPPTPPPVLVDNFRERCSALLQLSALPHISSSAVQYMQSPLLQDFLGESLMMECGNASAKNCETGIASNQEEQKLYYQAQKLISLCGWTLRSVPYIVDCKDISDHSVKNSTILDGSRVVADRNNYSLLVHSADTDESSKDSNGEQKDPNSAVLDCTLCGATVGLWAFRTVPRPVESIRLMGYAENLRARFSYDSGVRDHVSDSQKKISIQETTDSTVNTSNGQLVPVTSEIREVSDYETGLQASIHDSALDDLAAGDPFISQKDLTEGEALSVSRKTLDGEVGSLENYGLTERVENPVNSEYVHCSFGRDVRVTVDKAMEFDPIKQHRHFCPWISSIDEGEPGWKQTLSALYNQKNHLPHSPNRSSSSLPIVKVDDPVGSVRKLFMSPSTRRMKLTRISAQYTERR
ncbi:hypothetical protein RIF29_07799 [Crotalaria pallida]|uniref:C3HC-type domain-containing protein n=1 Tax=Crotalaria pallida TaxID=3830 RepID=A0AAN9J4U0_CROPI